VMLRGKGSNPSAVTVHRSATISGFSGHSDNSSFLTVSSALADRQTKEQYGVTYIRYYSDLIVVLHTPIYIYFFYLLDWKILTSHDAIFAKFGRWLYSGF